MVEPHGRSQELILNDTPLGFSSAVHELIDNEHEIETRETAGIPGG
jgi:hypothetical protein